VRRVDIEVGEPCMYTIAVTNLYRIETRKPSIEVPLPRLHPLPSVAQGTRRYSGDAGIKISGAGIYPPNPLPKDTKDTPIL